MNGIVDLLSIREDKVDKKTLLLLMIVAYAFGVIVRLFWYYAFADDPSFFWNGEMMINTNDGYYWAEGARDFLAGSKNYVDSPMYSLISIATAFVYKITPFSLDTIILYAPAYFSSFLVVPIILIARAFGHTILGFVAALLAVITWSYYNRTMLGYYDTDMFIIVLPTIAIYGVIATLVHKDSRFLIIAPLFAFISAKWHGGAYAIMAGVLIMTFVYTVIFDRKNLLNYKLITLLLIAHVQLFEDYTPVAIFALYFLFLFIKNIPDKIVYGIAALMAIYAFAFGYFDFFVFALNEFLISKLSAAEADIALKYYDVSKTVRELGGISFETFANRISGSEPAFFVSVFGYMLFLMRHPKMIVTLPMFGAGMVAIVSGLRFTVFAIPFAALGFGYFLFFIAKFLPVIPRIGVVIAGMALVLYPNVVHIKGYLVPTVFSKQNVEVLDTLKNIASKDDYVVTWWDYGYPIRYYANTKTIVDGGKHSGDVNFPVSFVLSTTNEIAAYNMAILSAYYTELAAKEGKSGNNMLEMMMKDYGYIDPTKFIADIGTPSFKAPNFEHDVYIYLPYKMFGIFPTVMLFSNIDLRTGNQTRRPFFMQSQNFQDNNGVLNLGNGVIFNPQTGDMKVQNADIKIRELLIVNQIDKNHVGITGQQMFNENGLVNVAFAAPYRTFFVADNDTFHSTFFKLFLFESYNKNLFELSVSSPYARVYKLKKR